jgi:acetylornithine deacetylase/succinyl-diaminopimelate desuccinylase-like protein
MANFASNSAFSRVTALASQQPVHAAFAWMHGNPKTIMDWQTELVGIPAPPFGEQARAERLAALFAEAGLSPVETDAAGNVFGWLLAASLPPESTGPVVVLSAHLDTVFPAGTPLQPAVEGDRLEAPGACDNGAGLAGLLAIAHALIQSRAELPAPLVFLGNVGEEGEGDLRGVRCLYSRSALAGRIAAHIILEGAGSNSAVTQALGSRRFRVTVTGPGGHSFTDAGATPNPIAALALALAQVAETPLPQNLPDQHLPNRNVPDQFLLDEAPLTTLNLGTIQGGTSVNSIPESAQATIDFRSTSADQLLRLEAVLDRAVEEAVERTNARAKNFAANGRETAGNPDRGLLAFQIEKIGDRPAAELPADAPLLEALRAVDRHLVLHTDLRLGSTDANIPLSLGIPALSMGAGGEGGGAHTRAEWYSAHNREAGLRRAMLLTLAMLEWAAEQ